MKIRKVVIKNFKKFEEYTLELSEGINVIVGDNEAGKSTILEAINLCLSGYFQGNNMRNELSEELFNKDSVKKYLIKLSNNEKVLPPELFIELYFTSEVSNFKGNGNSLREDTYGIKYIARLKKEYEKEYFDLINRTNDSLTALPIEYYETVLLHFGRDFITHRVVPIKSVLIDSTEYRYQSGGNSHVSRLIKDGLEDSERIELAQAYRKIQDDFRGNESLNEINKKIKEGSGFEKSVTLSVDLPAKNSWERSLNTRYDDIPFNQIGKGDQSLIKTKLALSLERSKNANIILIEEPENHLSYTGLNSLMKLIDDGCKNKQVIITTHSSFVANKLELKNLILIKGLDNFKFNELSESTYSFFKKLPGYETLRLILCNKAVLVEGPSDELIFQKCYMEKHYGKLPIQDKIDVISVKLTFKRFIEVAKEVGQKVCIVTDNDGKYKTKMEGFRGYESENVSIKMDSNDSIPTLEPQFYYANKDNNLNRLETLFGVSEKEEEMLSWMTSNKTEWSLRVFDSKESFDYPDYILQAVDWCDEK